MKYLNLIEGFNPYNAEEDELIKFESFFFNGGEPHIKLDIESINNNNEFMVTTRLRNMNEFMMLVVATEALEKCGSCEIKHLFIPYFPGARQDRRMVEGEPLSVKVFAKLINSLRYNEVIIFDPHSDVTPVLLDNCTIIDNYEFAIQCYRDLWDKYDKSTHKRVPMIVSPDAGAVKKVFSLNQILGAPWLQAGKHRDLKTGKLSKFSLNTNTEDFHQTPCVIIDDICDGGGTFIGLAEELKKKNAGDLYLIVSHGIFSKGFKELKKHFKAIYTTDSWVNDYAMEIPEIEKGSGIVNIINFKDFI